MAAARPRSRSRSARRIAVPMPNPAARFGIIPAEQYGIRVRLDRWRRQRPADAWPTCSWAVASAEVLSGYLVE